jgi:hypothetical protein
MPPNPQEDSMAKQESRQFGSLAALAISLLALSVSIMNLYIASLRAPQVEMRVAPYIRHGIDDTSGNEAFLVPLTMVNSGARATSILSLEMTIRHVPSGDEKTLYGQYFTEERTRLGELFSPIGLSGYSDVSRTVAFYPLGEQTDRILNSPGLYEFQITALISNVGGRSGAADVQLEEFRITLSPQQSTEIQGNAKGEYPFPLAIER